MSSSYSGGRAACDSIVFAADTAASTETDKFANAFHPWIGFFEDKWELVGDAANDLRVVAEGVDLGILERNPLCGPRSAPAATADAASQFLLLFVHNKRVA